MDDDSKKDDEQLTARFLINMKEEDKALFAQFAKDQKMSLAKFFRTAAKEYLANKGYIAESLIVGILEKTFTYRIVRVPVGEIDTFEHLISILMKDGYELLGRPFSDTEGCIMQLMVINNVIKNKKKG
jgi:hypothetical protein